MICLEQRKVPLYLRKVISSYLSGRILLYNTDDGIHSYNITSGVPQGSVLGPLLWNIVYDGLLGQILSEGVSIVAFADDVALVVVAKRIEEVQYIGEQAIEVVAEWLNSHGLSLAAEKTEAVLISRTKKRQYVTFQVENKTIRSVDAIKYLGITIDARLSFREHILNAGKKASETANVLAGIMPNIGGPKQPRRTLLSSVVSSVILYGAPIWADAMCSNVTYRATCRRACRTVMLRIARAYRTVSDIALSVIAGFPPIDLIAEERATKYREGRSSREEDTATERCYNKWSRRTYEAWQRRWDQAHKGRWTHRIIPDVGEWTNRKHGLVTFHLTQVLTGHGCFRSFLHRIRVYDSAECPTCPGRVEDVEHVFFHCPRFTEERELFLTSWGGPLTPEGMGRCLIASQEGWDAAVVFAKTVVERLNSIRKAEERRGRSD